MVAMTTELYLLASSVVLGLVHIILASHAANLQRGYRWSASARDDIAAPLNGVAARLERSARNYLETFTFFASAVMLCTATGRHNWMTVAGAHLYFWGRLAYLPLYAFGIPVVRSLAWYLAIIGIGLIAAALF
jgi:uncharacterized MAPEG superfamily protein